MQPISDRTVLIVDDVAHVRSLVEHIIHDPGIRVVAAADGESALEMAREHRPILIFLDLALPGLNGRDVIRELRADESTKEIPVVIVTALGRSDLAAEAFAMGAQDLIEKPFTPVEIRKALEKWARTVDPTSPVE